MTNGVKSASAALCSPDCRLFLLGHDLPWHSHGVGELPAVATGGAAVFAVGIDPVGLGTVEGMGAAGPPRIDSHLPVRVHAAGGGERRADVCRDLDSFEPGGP